VHDVKRHMTPCASPRRNWAGVASTT
jgi:hypothetical protein